MVISNDRKSVIFSNFKLLKWTGTLEQFSTLAEHLYPKSFSPIHTHIGTLLSF